MIERNTDYTAGGFDTIAQNGRLGLDPWTGRPLVTSSTAVVPYGSTYDNHKFQVPGIGNGIEEENESNIHGVDIDAGLSSESLEVDAITSKVMHKE